LRPAQSAALIESLHVTHDGKACEARNANVTRWNGVVNTLMGCCGKALLSGWLRAAAAVYVTLVAAAAPAQAAAPDAGAAASIEPALAGLMAMAALAVMWWRLLGRSDE